MNSVPPAFNRAWIKAETAKLTLPAEKLESHQEAARRAVGSCARMLERIKAGIDLIEADPLAEEAFRFANHAMWQQRIHSAFSRKVRKKELKEEFWPRLLETKQRVHFLKTDFDKVRTILYVG